MRISSTSSPVTTQCSTDGIHTPSVRSHRRGSLSVQRAVFSILWAAIAAYLPPLSLIWFAWMSLLLITRIHIICALCAYILVVLTTYFMAPFTAILGAYVLQRNVYMWTSLLSRPGIRLLQLHHAHVMGSLCMGILVGIICVTLFLVIRSISRTHAH